MNKYDGKQGTATDLLTYYLKTLFEANGLNWNSDNDSEIEALIDAIIQASREKQEQN